jgi:hypothetical protein
MKKIIFITFFTSTTIINFAQNNFLFNSGVNPLKLHPSMAGIENNARFCLNTTYNKISYNPVVTSYASFYNYSTQGYTLSYDQPIKKLKSAIGIVTTLNSDDYGSEIESMTAVYSGKIKFKNSSLVLSPSVRGGISSELESFDFFSNPFAEFGLMVNNESFYIGSSMATNLFMDDTKNLRNKYIAGYNYSKSDSSKFSLGFNMAFSHDQSSSDFSNYILSSNTFESNAYASYKIFSIGAGIQETSQLSYTRYKPTLVYPITLGVNFKRINLSYTHKGINVKLDDRVTPAGENVNLHYLENSVSIKYLLPPKRNKALQGRVYKAEG